MKVSRTAWTRVVLAVVIALAALFFIRQRAASGVTLLPENASAGRRLAEAWCKDCHAIEAATARTSRAAPDFTAIANRPSTTALSLKVFLQTSHPSMPNFIIAPNQTDDLVNYILSLKRG